ncbi:hypothetical protein RJ640_014830 [Escallonia rubra]|uniref:GAG-pre-integrase domain-containing protein n=1 Tax=Escallonia rubra TaxID=112253 RepID=A0AA88R835_9ASTE|nr:hypothetical protein RJ640_014830 [Escallonia rubra]
MGLPKPESTKNLTENQKKKLEEVRQKDANALSMIQRGVTKSIFPRIIRATKAKEAWDILKVEYHGDDKSYEQRLAKHSEKSIENAFQSKLHVGSSKNDERKFQNLGQNRKHTFGGKGDMFIRDVLLVPELDQNLLSVGQLLEHGHKLDFEGNGCIIYDNRKPRQLVKKIRMESNRTFPSTLKYVRDVAMKAHIVEDSRLWHKRFGHLNFQGLKLHFQKKKLVQGLPTTEDKHGVCEGCALGKHHRRPFMKEVARRAKGKLELVHTDVCALL